MSARRVSWLSPIGAATVMIVVAAGAIGHAQVQYAAGQNVAPTFEGWERNADGTYNLVFGYLNRNYEEQLDIPIGPDNRVDYGGDDQGQPTHFYPRRQRFVFKVVVPRDWDKTKKVTWSITSRGRTDVAKGWLQPEWELSEDVVVENMGGGVRDPNNKAPALKIGAVPSVTLPDTLTLTASAEDDGLPKPYRQSNSNPDRASRPRRPRGVQIKWTVYRAPGVVTLTPDSSAIVHGEPITMTTKATFSAPGTYVLRATANDGQLYTTRDLTLTVHGSGL